MNPIFKRYIGIDYSGAQSPKASLKGLRIYEADQGNVAREVSPPPSPRKYWTRREIAEWLVGRLSENTPALVGIDHGFSFPLKYFIHFWPFDGWSVPPDRSVIAEVYPALWSKSFPPEERTPDQHDAFAIANGYAAQMRTAHCRT